jgi:putative peptidoglycan binding protein/D-alanyl-D-alanine carboxypeptidase-like protein
MANSQNGYPASEDRDAIGVRTFQVPSRPDVVVPLRADIAPLILEFMRWWNATVEPLIVPGCWGYAFRPITGSTALSNHASGTAGDVNAPLHALGAVGTVPAGIRAAISVKAAALGLRWGGDYVGRKDEMHIEVNVPLAEALEFVRRLQSLPGRPTIQLGSTGQHVRDLQAHLKSMYPLYAGNLVVDGDFGPRTRAAVMEFQRRSGLVADGIVGPMTWGKLGI